MENFWEKFEHKIVFRGRFVGGGGCRGWRGGGGFRRGRRPREGGKRARGGRDRVRAAAIRLWRARVGTREFGAIAGRRLPPAEFRHRRRRRHCGGVSPPAADRKFSVAGEARAKTRISRQKEKKKKRRAVAQYLLRIFLFAVFFFSISLQPVPPDDPLPLLP